MNHSACNRSAPFPWITTTLCALALAAWFKPGASDLLQFDRNRVVLGAWWQVLSGHLTHWTASHLVWDLAAFALLGTLLERRSRTMLAATLITSACAISGAVWALAPEIASYRGLSGIDSAVFASLVTAQFVEALRARRFAIALWLACAATGLALKVAFESIAGSSIFVAPDASFVPVPLAHAVGAAAGLVVTLAYSSMENAAQVVAAWAWGSPTGRLRSR